MMQLAVLMLAALIVAHAHAQNYPSKTVRWIAPLPPGGSTDLISRLLAQKLSEMWRVQVVVENRVGAAGTIGLAAAAGRIRDRVRLRARERDQPTHAACRQ
ncbi:MAG TPA: hypothetical protein VGO08_00415 [Burkholderiales bacterium]|nr:hypothetical protein [Burkholderiales bacterium]